ncbi:MAG: hypothetical protein RRA15_04635 [bacterium]|nr:hypothetical protein [bacterium]MDT8365762.1 hypothetical protein [bacterium]
MHLSDEKIAELFGLLDRLGQFETEELLGHFTSDNIEAIRQVSWVLKEGMNFERVLSENRFVKVVQELYETKLIWAERLEVTLITAASEMDQGNRGQALWILSGFIRFCPSPYFREIAEDVMGEYEKSSEQ